MSRVGPSTFSILSMNERATAWSSAVSSLLGSTFTPPLAPPKGMLDDRRLPGHQLGERAHLVEVDLGVEADAALVGPARAVVLHAVAGEDVDLPVGELDRDLHLDLAVGGAQHGGDVVAQAQPLGGQAEPVRDDLVVRDLGAAGSRGVLGLLRGLVGLAVSRTGVRPGVTLLRDAWLRRSWPLALPRIHNRQPPKHRSGPTIPIDGAIAQLVERRLCKPEAAGSSPAGSIRSRGSRALGGCEPRWLFLVGARRRCILLILSPSSAAGM